MLCISTRKKALRASPCSQRQHLPSQPQGIWGRVFLWNRKSLRIWKYLLSVYLYVSVCGYSPDPGVRCPRAGFAGDCGFWEPNRAEKQDLLTSSFQPKRMGSLLEPSVAQGFCSGKEPQDLCRLGSHRPRCGFCWLYTLMASTLAK